MISENNPECKERGCVVATDSSNGEHFCLRCHKTVDLYNLGGIDTSKPADYAVVSRTHPIQEEPKLTKKMIDDLASNMGTMGDRDNMYLVEREYLEKLHDECSKIVALEYAVKVLAERLYYFAECDADNHGSSKILIEDPISYVDDDNDDLVSDSEIASDAVKKAAAEYEAMRGRKP